MSIKPELRSISLVILGGFNPKIFHPAWFQKNGLITELQEDETDPVVTTPDFAQFKAGWLNVFVDADRLQLSTTFDPYFEDLISITEKVMSLLSHTPIRAVGINNDGHFKIDTFEKWNALGHTLAPKKGIWDKILDEPGLLNISIREPKRRDGRNGHLEVRVQPSGLIHNLTAKRYGVYIQVNDHYDLTPVDEKSNSLENLKDILTNNWTENQKRWNEIHSHILSLVK